MQEKRLKISMSYLVLSYFKVTNKDSMFENDYIRLKKDICSKIESSSLKRKYNLVLSNDDSLILFAKHNNEMFVSDEKEKAVYIKNDIKTKMELKSFGVDQYIERIIIECFKNTQLRKITRKKYVDPNLDIELSKLYPSLTLK